MKIESYSWKHRLAKLSFHLQKARRSKYGDNIQSKTSLNEIISLKEKTTPFPTNTTFKSNKKHTNVNVTNIYDGKDYLTLHHSSTSQFPLNPYAKTFAPHTLSIRMNVGRKGTSYLRTYRDIFTIFRPKKAPLFEPNLQVV